MINPVLHDSYCHSLDSRSYLIAGTETAALLCLLSNLAQKEYRCEGFSGLLFHYVRPDTVVWKYSVTCLGPTSSEIVSMVHCPVAEAWPMQTVAA